MTIPLAVVGHRGYAWGVIFIVLALAHLTYRGFYARRAEAIHDVRQDTAPAMTRPFYRRHSRVWYSRWTVYAAILLLVYGIVDVVTAAS